MVEKIQQYKISLFQEEVASGVHDLFRLGYMPGFQFGEVSVRDPESGYVYITPQHGSFRLRDLSEFHGCDVIVVDADGNLVDGHAEIPEWLPLHLAVYKARADHNAIIRTSTRWTAAYAARGEDIPYVLAEQGALGGTVLSLADKPEKSVSYYGKVLSALEAHHVVNLNELGVVSGGVNITRAVNFLVWLDSVARKYTRACLIGEPCILPKRTKPLHD